MSFYRATLTGRKPFSSFTVPGVSPSVVVNRQGALLDAETTRTLKKALKAGDVPNVKPEDVAIVEVADSRSADQPGKPAPSDDVEALRDRIAELEDEVEALTAERDELSAKYDTAVGERDALRAQLEDSDSTALASGILDSMTVPDLRALAESRKVEGLTSSSTKADIIAGLVAPPPSA